VKRFSRPGARAALENSPTGSRREDEEHRHAGQSLEGVAPVLGLYYRALSGRNAALVPYGNRSDPQQYPDTHTTIRLPDRMFRFVWGNGNFLWYKVALTHRAAHYEGGTFGFAFVRPAIHFASLRPAGMDGVKRHEHESDLETFFGLFAQRQLAVEIFTVMEDLRLDEWSKRRYPGLRSGFEKIQRAALHDRPSITGMGPRNALVEAAVRISLGTQEVFDLPTLLHEPVRRLVQTMQALTRVDARVEDSAEAAMRAYCLVVGLPNIAADFGASSKVDLSLPPSGVRWPNVWPEPEKTSLEGDEVLATALAPVSYRDQLGSRYTRTKARGRSINRPSTASPKTARRLLQPRQPYPARSVQSRPRSRWSTITTITSAKTKCTSIAASCIATSCSLSSTRNGITLPVRTNAIGVASRNRASIRRRRRAISTRPCAPTAASRRKYKISSSASRARVCARSGAWMKATISTSTPRSRR
jgi:hypothetical protein